MDYCESCSNKRSQMDFESHPSRESYSAEHQSQRNKLRRQPSLKTVTPLLLVLLATIIPVSLASSTCSRNEYWDPQVNDCVPCTKCSRHEIVVRPCQRHMDTLCKPLNSIEIDWSKSLASQQHQRHHHHHNPIQADAQASTLSEEELVWDWQLVTLILAVVACLTFFIGTALISINYIRQWRKIKKQFDNDIEGLSQQLMARLAVPTHEGSTIFVDDPTSKRSALGPRQIEVRCVYLEDILDGKEILAKDHRSSQILGKKNPATNVYINDHK